MRSSAGSKVQVIGKEVLSLSLYKQRDPKWRLDVAPFVSFMSLACGMMFAFAVKGEWVKFTYTQYATMVLALLEVLLLLFEQWFVSIKALAGYRKVKRIEDAHVALVVPPKFKGSAELVDVERKTLGEGGIDEYSFEFRKFKFVYNADQGVFEKLRYPVKDTFDSYMRSSGLGSQDKLLMAFEKFGPNRFEVPLPPFMKLLKEQMLAPFFVFQVFCVVLWCLDEYWKYSMFTLFMLVTFECTMVGQRLRNLRELRALAAPKQQLHVYRCGRWDVLAGEALLPGDLVSIGRPGGGAGGEEKVVPADCLLLAGSCIVEEAVLTGESTPQWKLNISECEGGKVLHIKQDKAHMLFGGTKVLQHTGDKDARIRTPDGGCLAVVLRTGFETSQGRLMRTILFSTERVTANSWEAGLFIAFLLIFALSASYYVLVNGLKDPNRDRFKLILNCIMIITSVIPPELPMELSIAVNASLVSLARKFVFCTEPFRIPFAGKIDICCFDKTGTLTSDHLLFEGVTGLHLAPSCNEETSATALAIVDEGDAALVSDPKELPLPSLLVLAACQSLVTLNEELIGDPLEKASLTSINWHYTSNLVTSPSRKVKATILHRHHFSSALKRMSATLRVDSEERAADCGHMAVMKGAPETVKHFLATVPDTYDATYKTYAARGARVIALAARRLPADLDAVSLRGLTREEVECDMEFAGFAVFQCPLKRESEPALRMLRESCHMLVMITGDAPLTACYAASQVHIVTRDVLMLAHRHEEKGHSSGAMAAAKLPDTDQDFVWVSPDEAVQREFSRDPQEIVALAAQYDLCVSGDALAYVDSIGLTGVVVPLTQVFARVNPDQKELILVTLRARGLTTLMCGDGTNDVGALKAADIGVALLAPSDIAERIKKAREAAKKEAAKKTAVDGAADGKKALSKADDEKKKKDIPPGQKMIADLERAGKPIPPNLRKMAQWMDDMVADTDSGQPPMLKPGDASMAAAFTAKASSVLPCCDIIKQGRCTLVTTIQMFKILGLMCLSTAFTLSVMYFEGVKLGDMQATLNGMLTAGLFFFISTSKPLDKMSPARPHPSIFSPYFFLSMCGQFAVQLSFLMYMYRQALAAMPEDDRLGVDSEFKPNLVNSVCYLVELAVQLSTFAVNYVGHPFNTSIRENSGLYKCLMYAGMFLTALALDLIPGLGQNFGLVDIPPALRTQLVLLGGGMFAVNFTLEHVLRNLFPARIPKEKGYMMFGKELSAVSSAKKHN